ncbi:MAG: sugar transferase [Bacteroidota bacterium]
MTGNITHSTSQFIQPANEEILIETFDDVDVLVRPVLFDEYCPLDGQFAKILKRTFDLTFTLLAFVFVLWWLIPLFALLVKLSSKGPVFFIQTRTGMHNEPFLCIKFRSMYVNEHAHLKHATRNDTRVTPIGYFLRKFSLDELPQFINVFLGQMSIVGPRPLMLKHTEQYAQQMDSFMVRHRVKPGITGLSQIKGYRGEMYDNRMLRNRLKFDLFYLAKWNLFLDAVIIIKSLKLMLFGDDNAY